MKKIILIDNYDSFTFNLYHYLSSLKVNVDVIRNDQISSKDILKRKLKLKKVKIFLSLSDEREYSVAYVVTQKIK